MTAEMGTADANRRFWDHKLDEVHRRWMMANKIGQTADAGVIKEADYVESPGGEPMPATIMLGED